FLIYTGGEKNLARNLHPMEMQPFLEKFASFYHHRSKIAGTALFFSGLTGSIPVYITRTMFVHGIIYQNNVIISILSSDEAYGIRWNIREVSPGLKYLTIRFGYMKVFDLLTIIRLCGIHETTIFFGMDEIVTPRIVWKIFALIKRLSPSFTQYYHLPPDHVHGVITRSEM
ncbi:MAG: potassium transporter Kup, partial [Methanospirillum sp.]|nr:potassium transporter Kup [Methanospirillum sp.]